MTTKYDGPSLLQVKGGAFLSAEMLDSRWRFTFANKLILESKATWRVTENKGFLSYPVLGPLDYESPLSTSERLSEVFSETELKVLCFQPDMLVASMQGEEKLLKLELICLSASRENWLIHGEDFEDSDQKMLLARREHNDA